MLSSCLSLRLVISAICAVAVACVAALTLTITLTSSLVALRSLGEQHAGVLLRVAITRTEAFLDLQADAVESAMNYTASYDYGWPSDNNAVFDIYTEQQVSVFLQAQRRLGVLVTTFRDNTVFIVAPDPADGGETYVSISYHAQPLREVGFYNTTVEERVRSRFRYNDNRRTYEPFTPPTAKGMSTNSSTWQTYHQLTGNAQFASFPGVFPFEFGRVRLQMACGAPLYGPGAAQRPENLLGFVVANMDIDQVNIFLRSVRGTPGTVAMALDGAGYMAASSEGEQHPFHSYTDVASQARPPNAGCASTELTSSTVTGDVQPTTWKMVCRVLGTEYTVPTLVAAAADAELATTDTSMVKHVRVAGELYFLAASRVQLRFRGVAIRLVLAMPEADVIGDVVRARNVAIGVTVGVFVVATGAVFVAIALLLSPLEVVAERMRRAANLEDDDTDAAVSSMAEVRGLQMAYYDMNSELNRIRGFVPQAALMRPQLDSDGDHREDDEVDGQELSAADGAPLESKRLGTATASSEDELEGSLSVANVDDLGDSPNPSLPDAGTRRSKGPSSGSSSTMLGGPPLPPPLVAINPLTSLRSHSVSVVVVNGVAFLARVVGLGAVGTGAAASSDRAAVLAHVEAASQRVVRVLKDHGGVLDSFHGDHYVATFNAAKSCGSHARQACLAALELSSGAEATPAAMRIGVATGRALVGTVGSTQAKAFSTIGTAHVQASVLERMTRVYGCRVLAARRTCVDAAAWLQFVFLDVMPVAMGVSDKASAGHDLVGAIVGIHENAAAEDEWLYVVADGGNRVKGVEAELVQHNALFEAVVKASQVPATTLARAGESIATGSERPLPYLARERRERVQRYVQQHGGVEGYESAGEANLYRCFVGEDSNNKGTTPRQRGASSTD